VNAVFQLQQTPVTLSNFLDRVMQFQSNLGEQLIAFLYLADGSPQVAICLGSHSLQLFACTHHLLIAVSHLSREAAHLSIRRDQPLFAFLYLADGSPQVAIRLGSHSLQLFA
jgi:hypothetical protein